MNIIRKLFPKWFKAKRNFPSWAASKCHFELAHAKAALLSKGVRLKDHDLKVIFRAGSWYVAEATWKGGGAQVNALTHWHGKVIECACNEIGNAGTIHTGSLQHEMAHHWLICNGLGGGHDARFDDVLPGWREARRIVGK